MSELERTLNQSFMAPGASAGGVGSSKGAPKGRRVARSRKFYIVDGQARSRAAGLKMVNQSEVFEFGTGLLSSVNGRRGFHDGQVTPVFLADERSGQIDRDFEIDAGYWVVTDRMKAVLEQVDPEAVTFLKCDTKLPNGAEGARHWLCHIVPVLDALDEEKSIIRIGTSDAGTKVYNLLGPTSLIFDPQAVGQCHLFRMKYFQSLVICDEELRRACKETGITGISFKDAIEGMI